MATLTDRLLEALPKVLPADPDQAINGKQLLALVRPLIGDHYADNSIRQTFSVLSKDASSPIARVEHGQGYYRRAAAGIAEAEPDREDVDEGRDGQREEKFRAIYMRHQASNNLFPMKVEHTTAARRAAGVNRWKFPDVIVLAWEVGELTDDGFQLDEHLLEVKRSLGEQPFRLGSVELKVDLSLASFRPAFFQCVSNSKWAHTATLAVAAPIADQTLAEELGRLGASYDVSVVSFGLDPEKLDGLPPAGEILAMDDDGFDELVSSLDLRIRTIATSRTRSSLDWEHLSDMRSLSSAFKDLFGWIATCLGDHRAYPFQDFLRLRAIRGQT